MSLLSTIGKGLGAILGGVANPVGTVAGILGGGGGGYSGQSPYGPPPGVPGNINLPAIGGQTSINLPGFGAPGFGVTYTPSSAAPMQLGPGGGGKGLAAALVLSGQIPAVTNVQTVSVPRAPAGYVIVQTPQGPRAMLRELAYSLGIKKRPSRGGLTKRDIQGAYRTQALVKRLTVCKPKHPLKTRKGKR